MSSPVACGDDDSKALVRNMLREVLMGREDPGFCVYVSVLGHQETRSSSPCPRPTAACTPPSPPSTRNILLRDLRLWDNPALSGSLEVGAPVISVFIWSPEEEEGSGITVALEGVYRYEKVSGRADAPNTSCLSPYLHFGQLSPHWLLWDAKETRWRPPKFERKRSAWRDAGVLAANAAS
ncbi:hypothetical protein PAMA_019334 [Pampus argenteus]